MNSTPNRLDVWDGLSPYFLGQTASYDPVLRLIIKLSQADANSVLLKNIDEKLKKLMSGHLNSGKDLLEDAEATEDPSNEEQYLNEARLSFIQASNVSVYPEDARAMEYTAVCHYRLGDKKLGWNWLKKTYGRLLEHHNTYYQKALDSNNAIPKTFRTIFGALPFLGTVAESKGSEAFVRRLVDLFQIEAQIRHLRPLLLSQGFGAREPNYFFSSNIARIEPDYHMSDYVTQAPLSHYLRCYDKNNRVLKSIEYTYLNF